MARLTINATIQLRNASGQIPRLGLGVYKSHSSSCANAVGAALKAGYRHIDTAAHYGNEKEVGEGVRRSGIPRSEIFVTTKIMRPVENNTQLTYEAMVQGVERIGLDYVDLFLIHSPGCGKAGRQMMWSALERLQDEGKTKAIGVSNYGEHHLQEMKIYAKNYPPTVNQIELHPWFQQQSLVEFCSKEGIPLEAYCPLVRQEKANDPVLLEVANAYHRTPNQILVRWSLQKGFIVLPKSENPERIAENAAVYDFEILDVDMQKLDGLDEGRTGAIAWTPQFGA